MSSETKSRVGRPTKLDALNKAFQCAYIECPAHVVDDLRQRFNEYLAEQLESSSSAVKIESGTELNLRYGHQADCAFGLKNSGMCDCGKGFTTRSADPGTTGAEGLAELLAVVHNAVDHAIIGIVPAEALTNKWREVEARVGLLHATATQRAPVTPPAPDIAAYYRGVEAAVELLRAYKLPSQAERNTNVKTINEYIEEIAKDILAHRESAQAYAECGPTAAPAPVTTPGRDERLVQALPTIIRSLQISVDRAKEDVEARKRQRERMPFDHDNNDALLKCEAWLDDTVEALAAAKEPRG